MVLGQVQARCLQDFALRNGLLALTHTRLGGVLALPRSALSTTPASATKGQRATPARLVETHSSYMDGLMPLLDRFVSDPDAVSNVNSVVPGRIYVVKGRSDLFKMTVRDTNNGFKALARKGTLCQEVFISTTTMDLDDVKTALNRAAGFDLETGGTRREQKAGRKRR